MSPVTIQKSGSSLTAFSSVQSLSRVRLFATPWIGARQASLSITNSCSSLRLTSIESVMPSSHLILCHPLLLLPPVPPSIRVFSSESTLHEVAKVLEFQLQHHSHQRNPRADLLQNGLVAVQGEWISLQSKGLSRVFSNTTVQKRQFFGAQLSSQSNPYPYMTTGKTIALTRRTFVGKVIFLLLNMLSSLVIAFPLRSRIRLLFSLSFGFTFSFIHLGFFWFTVSCQYP